MDLISEKVESLCGYKPGPEDVEDFLLKLNVSAATQVTVAQASVKAGQTTQIVSERSVSYTLLGQPKQAENAIGALMDILRALAARDTTFLEKLAPVVRGRTRNHLARKREDVYPGKPEALEYTVQLVPGWWLGTNIANRDRMAIIQKACGVAKLVLGKDVVITLPNA
jgi:hypothetical protein